MPNQAKSVREIDAHVARLSDGRWSWHVEHCIPVGRKPECDTHLTGHFDTEAEALAAALDLAKKIAQFP